MIVINKKFELVFDKFPNEDGTGFRKVGEKCKLHAVSGDLVEMIWDEDIWNPDYISPKELKQYFKPA
tara:strand:+ start:11076 stop:11276 length:201 start_codon:yes stop_codon:yes gene_type:complete